MTLASGDELLGRAERAVEQAMSRGAHEAECWWQSAASLEVEIQGGEISNAGRSQGSGAAIRVVREGRVGFAYYTEPEGAGAAIARALENLRLAPAKGYSLPFPGRSAPLKGRWDERVAALDVADALPLAEGILAGARESAHDAVVAGGGIGLDAGVVAIASSHGLSAWDRETGVGGHASLVLEGVGRTVTADESETGHRLALDAKAVGRRAGERLLSLRDPQPSGASGPCDVVLRPNAVAELILGIVVSAATGDEAKRGRSMWSDALGKPVADSGFTLADEPRHPEAIGGAPFDGEGVPTGRVPLVEKGLLRTFLYDSWDAHQWSGVTTASAVRGGFKSRPETGVHHVVVSHRTTAPMDRLVAGMEDGFVVESVLGAHTANATTGDFSVTAPAVWRVRGGAVEGPVTEVAIAGNLGELLRRVDGASQEVKAMEGSRVPSLRFRGVAVSS